MSLLGLLFKRQTAASSTREAHAASTRAQAEAAKRRGNAHAAAGAWTLAYQAYAEAVALDPQYVDAYINLGTSLRELQRYPEAELAFARAEQLAPAHPTLHYSRGLTALATAHYGAAEAALRQAHALAPDETRYLWALCDALSPQFKHAALLEVCQQLMQREPERYEAAINAWVCRHYLGQTADAIAGLEALFAKHSDARIALALAMVLKTSPRWRDAETWTAKAMAMAPDFSGARWNHALLLLMRGNYIDGWPLFDQEVGAASRVGAAPTEREAMAARFGDDRLWRGQELHGRRLLVWHEQGLGDTLMMLRYVPLLKRRFAGLRLDVLVPPSLVRLAQTMADIDQVWSTQAPPSPSEVDHHCAFLSLPRWIGTTVETIPAADGYLTIAAPAVDIWRQRLAHLGPGRHVGLVWAGNPRLARDQQRSIALSVFSPLFEISGVHWISLQKGEAAAQRALSPSVMTDWMDECTDFYDTAALMCALDLVISVDSAPAHLSGALGRPTWLLNRYESEWRWMRDQTQSPWYSSVRIVNQATPNAWDGTIASLRAALSADPAHTH